MWAQGVVNQIWLYS